MLLPPLPALDVKLSALVRGPTEYTNWVIPGILMAGCFPGALDDARHGEMLRLLLSRGIDTFVCLQQEFRPDITEARWRAGRGLRPYLPEAVLLSNKELLWRHVPIPDGLIAPDDVTLRAVKELLEDLASGRVLYVHCWGGHGRTGVFCCLLLVGLYRISASEALRRVQRYHDCRQDPQDARSPQSVVQREQVRRLAPRLLETQVEVQVEVCPARPKSANRASRPSSNGSTRQRQPRRQVSDICCFLPSMNGASAQEDARAALRMRPGLRSLSCGAARLPSRKSFT